MLRSSDICPSLMQRRPYDMNRGKPVLFLNTAGQDVISSRGIASGYQLQGVFFQEEVSILTYMSPPCESDISLRCSVWPQSDDASILPLLDVLDKRDKVLTPYSGAHSHAAMIDITTVQYVEGGMLLHMSNLTVKMSVSWQYPQS